MEELYVEILYTIFHMIGCDAEKTDQGALVDHLKEAFHMGLFHLQQGKKAFGHSAARLLKAKFNRLKCYLC